MVSAAAAAVGVTYIAGTGREKVVGGEFYFSEGITGLIC